MNRNWVLGLSLAFNLLLLGTTGYLVAGRLTEHPVTPAPAQPVVVRAEVKPEPQPAAPEPFSWSQVEAADYPTYIANLRKIGCPEQTIKDIVRADVAGVYEVKLRELTAQAGGTSSESAQARTQLQGLAEEKHSVLDQLFPGSGPQAPGTTQSGGLGGVGAFGAQASASAASNQPRSGAAASGNASTSGQSPASASANSSGNAASTSGALPPNLHRSLFTPEEQIYRAKWGFQAFNEELSKGQ